VPAESAKARELIGGAKAELGLALEELRELAHGIHPQILSERGLAAAVETLAGRSPLPVRVAAPGPACAGSSTAWTPSTAACR